MKKHLYFVYFFCLLFTYDILFLILTKSSFVYNFFNIIIFDILVSLFCYSIVGLLKNKKIVCLIISLIFAIIYMAENIIFNNTDIYMSLFVMLTSAKNVIRDFGFDFFSIIKNSKKYILIYLIPLFIFLFISKYFEVEFDNKKNKKILFISFLCILISIIFSNKNNFDYFILLKNYGLVKANILNIVNDSISNKYIDSINKSIKEDNEIHNESKDLEIQIENKKDEYNILDLDFENLIKDENEDDYNIINKYINSTSGSKKNKWTNLFKNKNLILICAEAFSKYVINEELTPTLYRLTHNGINFTNYYQPSWGGSTSTGEYSFLTGLVPCDGGRTMHNTIDKNIYWTMPKALKKLGYNTYAFHNGAYDFYERNLTHENLGFDKYIGIGNGLEDYMELYEDSDLFVQTLKSDEFIKEPFCLYYMTMSGHAFYNDSSLYKVRRKIDRIKKVYGDKYNSQIENYLSYQLYLEDGLNQMLSILDEKGVLDNTVICLTADHYPYGLKSLAYTNGENYLYELYNKTTIDKFEKDENTLIIWTPAFENDKKEYVATISEPTYSLDILPTLLNLFGINYDSRLLVGRDVFSDLEPLVIYQNGSFINKYGKYFSDNNKFISNDGQIFDSKLLEYYKSIVNNKIKYSKFVLSNNYFDYLIENKILEP